MIVLPGGMLADDDISELGLLLVRVTAGLAFALEEAACAVPKPPANNAALIARA
jgi:hypothetical protein